MKVLEHDKETMTCGACGGQDAGYHTLNNNHGSRDYATAEDSGPVCLSMNLTRNHVYYYGRLIMDPSERRFPMHCRIHNHSFKKWNEACGLERLRLSITRAEEVWPVEMQGWLEKYRLIASDSPAGQSARLIAAVLS